MFDEKIEEKEEIKILSLILEEDVLFNVKNALRSLNEEYIYQNVESHFDLQVALDTFSPHFIIVDCLMESVDGSRIYSILRNNKAIRNSIILILIPLEAEALPKESFDAGLVEYIRKPVSEYHLKRYIALCWRLMRYQRVISKSYQNHFLFNRRLYRLNKVIQKMITVDTIKELEQLIPEFRQIFSVDSIELVLQPRDELESQKIWAFNDNYNIITFEQLRKKTSFFDNNRYRLSSLKLETKKGQRIYFCMREISLDADFYGYIIFGKNNPFESDQENLISLYADFLGIMLESVKNKKIIHDQVHNYRSEIAKVRKIQVSFLPSFEDIKTFDIDFCYLPATELSGDFFDGYFLSDDIFQLTICDVSGHGVASSYIGNEIRSLLRISSSVKKTPSQVLTRLNDIFSRDVKDLYYFATMIVLQLNCKTGEITYASGGHPAMLYYNQKDDDLHKLESTGPIVGIFPDQKYLDYSFLLAKDDCLLLYTDGLTEAFGTERKKMYGLPHLEEEFLPQVKENSMDIVHSLVGSVFEFTNFSKLEDDLTIICIKKKLITSFECC